MNWLEGIQIEQTENTIWLTDTEQLVVSLVHLINTHDSTLSL